MEAGLGVMMLQSIAALAMVLALFAALVWGLKRFQLQIQPRNTDSMRVVQRLSLGSKHSLVEVQRGSESYILAISSSDMRLIDKLESIEPELIQEKVEGDQNA
ncbi:MAG: flagellar biosynthetic protein FliO [Mariprofundaceae bacterium]